MKTILTSVVAIAMSAIMLLTGIGPIAGNVDVGIGKENGVVYKTEDIDDFITEEQTVESVEIITDFVGNRFKLYELSPTGYAIYSIQGEASIFIEGSYATNSPYYGAENGKYYLGIGEYFTETSARSREVRSVVTGKTVEKEELLGATFAVDEKHYKVGEEIQATNPSTPDPNKTVWSSLGFTLIKNHIYFSYMKDIPLNEYGTCGIVAACMLLGYYDANVDDDIITDSSYVVKNSSGKTIGTTQALHDYLFVNCLHTTVNLGHDGFGYPMTAWEIRQMMLDYQNAKLPQTVRSRIEHYSPTINAIENAKKYLNGGNPIVLSLLSYVRANDDETTPEPYVREYFHNVVAYGYDANNRFMVHFGWRGNDSEPYKYTQIIVSEVSLNSVYAFMHDWA